MPMQKMRAIIHKKSFSFWGTTSYRPYSRALSLDVTRKLVFQTLLLYAFLELKGLYSTRVQRVQVIVKRIYFIATFVCFTCTCTWISNSLLRQLSKHFHAKMAAKLSTLLIKSVQLLGVCPQTSTRGSAPGPSDPAVRLPVLTENRHPW